MGGGFLSLAIKIVVSIILVKKVMLLIDFGNNEESNKTRNTDWDSEPEQTYKEMNYLPYFVARDMRYWNYLEFDMEKHSKYFTFKVKMAS